MTYKVTIATGPTSLLTDEARSEYEELLALLLQDDIDGEIAERVPSGAGVTWIEVTEIWLISSGPTIVAGWALEKVLDAVSGRAMQWVKGKCSGMRWRSCAGRYPGHSCDPEYAISRSRHTLSAWHVAREAVALLSKPRGCVGTRAHVGPQLAQHPMQGTWFEITVQSRHSSRTVRTHRSA